LGALNQVLLKEPTPLALLALRVQARAVSLMRRIERFILPSSPIKHLPSCVKSLFGLSDLPIPATLEPLESLIRQLNDLLATSPLLFA